MPAPPASPAPAPGSPGRRLQVRAREAASRPPGKRAKPSWLMQTSPRRDAKPKTHRRVGGRLPRAALTRPPPGSLNSLPLKPPRPTAIQVLVRWIKKFIAGAFLFALLLALLGFLLPSKYRVSRSVMIEAGPDAVFPLVNRLSRWPEWTAWTTNRDPSMVYVHQGAPEGVGAVQTWASR